MTTSYVVFWIDKRTKARGEDIVRGVEADLIDHIKFGHLDLRQRTVEAIYGYGPGDSMPCQITARVGRELAAYVNETFDGWGQRPRPWLADFIESVCTAAIPAAADMTFACE